MKQRTNNNITNNTSSSTKKIYDEKEQNEIIAKYRRDAATFDSAVKWIFLVLSVALSGAAIFVVARFDAKEISNSLDSSSFSSGDHTETALRHWFFVLISLGLMTYGTLTMMRFRPEKDWKKWLNVAGSASSSIDKKKLNDSDNDDNNGIGDAEIRFFAQQNKNQNVSFLRKYSCLILALCLLSVQLLFLAANKNIYPPEQKWTINYLFYHCSSSILALAHAGCWPIMIDQMCTTQRDLAKLESKKYRISDA